MKCPGNFTSPIRVHPETGAGECDSCGTRFDAAEYVFNNYRSQGTGVISTFGPYLPPHHQDGRRINAAPPPYQANPERFAEQMLVFERMREAERRYRDEISRKVEQKLLPVFIDGVPM